MKFACDIDEKEIFKKVEDSIRSEIEARSSNLVYSMITSLFQPRGINKAAGFMQMHIRKEVDDYALSPIISEYIKKSIDKHMEEAVDDAVKMAIRHVAKKMIFTALEKEES